MLPTASPPLEIFTDGSFDISARLGGWAFVVIEDGQNIHTAHGAAAGQSNNSLELFAIVEAMSWIEQAGGGRKVILWTDSAYVVEGCHRYRAIWRNNGWKRIDPKPRGRRRSIPDAALWQTLDASLGRSPNASIAWCKGHSGNAANERADMLARLATSAFAVTANLHSVSAHTPIAPSEGELGVASASTIRSLVSHQ